MTQATPLASWLDRLGGLPERLAPGHLAALTAAVARRPDLWRPLARHDPVHGWCERLLMTGAVEVWLMGWAPGRAVPVHDHRGAAGALTVAEGSLVEEEFDGDGLWHRRSVTHEPGTPAAFDAGHVHRLVNPDGPVALSVHAYSPAHPTRHCCCQADAPATVDDLLARARARLCRLTPDAAAEAQRRGALLVDIRPEAQRALEGVIPGAEVVSRNVLEWRLDPRSAWCIPQIVGHDREVVVVCSAGYTSSLAAAALQDLGLHRATDLIGGFQAWAAAGLPTEAV